LLSISPRQIFI
jgi:hypothetical protein